MSANNLESTNTYANERPANGQCAKCSKEIEPFLRPPFLGLSARWFSPNSLCIACHEENTNQARIFQEQKMLDAAFHHSQISQRFKQRTFENFVAEPSIQKAYDIAINFQPKNNGLLLMGPCGVGKTHLAAAIANKQIGKVPTLFISCPELLFEMREIIGGRKKHLHQYLFDLARKGKFLVLDDIGAEKSSEWVQETLFILVNYRYEHMLPTVFTTNCRLGELEAKVGKRTASRIIEMCRCLWMEGEDWRIKSRMQKVGA